MTGADADDGAQGGLWSSPISAHATAAGRLRIGDVQLDGGDVYWVEGRPAEAGRCVIVRERGGVATDLIDAPFSARTRVHEYGGGAMRAHGGAVYFSNAGDARAYRLGAGAPEPLTPALGDLRFTDFDVDARRERVVCVAEDHRGPSVVNDIRTIPLAGGDPVSIIAGNDFYSTPRVSPDGARLAWLTWNQPNMPWDGCELWTATLDDAGLPRDPRLVAGGATESIFQPSWSPESVLHFTSDRTGWWNLYQDAGGPAVPLAPMDAECGGPQWLFALSAYAFCAGGRIALWACRNGSWEFHIREPSGELRRVGVPYTQFGMNLSAHGDDVVFLAGAPDAAPSVVRCNVDTGEHHVVRAVSDDVMITEQIRSIPRHVTFPGHGGDVAHAWYYAPHNDAAHPAPEWRPPLLVRAHGGPTSATSVALDPSVQYWTSRGFAYLDVDYGGSSGYGRAYRERLDGQAGVVDVGDCVAGARFLVDTDAVDPRRLFIHGGSAGGYVVLCAMTFHDVFQAGASLYGIADLEVLFAQDSHKFESRYEAPYPKGQARYERSPVHFINRVRGAVLLLQGLDDPVVPKAQADLMFAALQAGGVPCAYIAFPGEEHGFRQAANIARSTEAQLYVFATVTRMPLAESIEPVAILNL